MRLIHTADLHLDTCFTGPGLPAEYGLKRRERQREALAAVLRHAWERQADAVLIAGDLFELDHVTGGTVAFLREQFAGIAPVPVLIAPGNKDPYLAESPYAAEEWPENVHIFKESQWTPWVSGESPLTVHGFGFDARTVPEGRFGGLRAPRDGRAHVALGHAGERAHLPKGYLDAAPFSLSEMDSPGLHYLALGHVHRCLTLRESPGFCACYAGPPEPLSFGEPGPCHFLEVEITPPANGGGAAVSVTRRQSSKRVHVSLELDCSAHGSAPDIFSAVRGRVPGPETPALLRLTLTGRLEQGAARELAGLLREWRGELESLVVEDRTLPGDDSANWAEEDTALGDFTRSITEAVGDAPTPEMRRFLELARAAGQSAFLGADILPDPFGEAVS
ncbi:MAG: DNA repair exonuclease [Candidatus Hydrogenedens sp.]|nr:DNA repair exonuclease [Candidatus Hydrogenedentota bacterium]NLF56414.1 DNA repair exonuclease [Candidatus Hydrogenedens sp.]